MKSLRQHQQDAVSETTESASVKVVFGSTGGERTFEYAAIEAKKDGRFTMLSDLFATADINAKGYEVRVFRDGATTLINQNDLDSTLLVAGDEVRLFGQETGA